MLKLQSNLKCQAKLFHDKYAYGEEYPCKWLVFMLLFLYVINYSRLCY